MRRLWIATFLLAGCAGGQTGEITGLTACSEPIDTIALDAPSAAGRAATEQLLALATTADADWTWLERGTRTAAHVSVALDGDAATVIGGPECERPYLEAPVVIVLRTDDGALDESIDGVVTLSDGELAVATASVSAGAMNGTLDLGDDAAVLRIDVQADTAAMHGVLSLDASDDTERLIATF